MTDLLKRVGPSGPEDAKIMIIGEAPGAEEVHEGKPFVGYSGKLLRDVLSSVGIDPEKVYFTNLSKTRPPNNELRSYFDKKGIPNSELLGDLAILRDEINTVNPNVIIPVGSYPLKFLTGKGAWKDGYGGISTYRGSILEGSAFAGGRKCVPTYHPAAATRQYSLKHIMRTDIARAKQQSEYPDIRRPRKFIVIDPRGADRDNWIGWLSGPAGTESPIVRLRKNGTTYAGESGCDSVEPLGAEGEWERATFRSSDFLTGDIEYVGSKLLCLGLTRHADVAVVFPTRGLADISDIRSLLLCGVPLCFQNAMFDCSILEYFYEIPCLQYLKHDTMIAMHAAYTEYPKDLGFIGSLFTEQPVWFDELNAAFWKKIKNEEESVGMELPLQGLNEKEDKYLKYNAIDVWVTHAAMESLISDELQDKHVSLTYSHEMSLIRPLWEIGKRGVLIDTTALNTLKSTLETEAATLLAGIAQYAGGKEVNVKSPPQVADFLYGVMQVPQTGPKTPTGKWKMDDDTLAALSLKVTDAKQKSAIKMIRDCRERLDLISKFCEIELDEDGRMRCHYDPAKTETGRLSSRKFYPTGRGTNLQNVPRDTRVRAVFVPDRGQLFAYADLKSAESLVVAHVTGDPEMLRLHSPEYMSGSLDGHKYVASFLLDKPIEQITKDERYLGKRVRHAGNYSLGWFRLMQLINGDAQKTGVSIDAAKAKVLITKYRQLHPMLEVWWSQILGQLWETHTIFTRHGRKRIFYGRPDEVLPEAIAYDPQGSVAQTLNMGLMRLEPQYSVSADQWMRQWDATKDMMAAEEKRIQSALVNELGCQMLLQVHDAIGFQFPEKNADKILPLVRELMAIPVPISRRGIEPYEIIIPVEIQTGYNWGEHDEKKNPNGLKSWQG